MTQQFIITGNVEISGDRNLLQDGRIEAYDRDLPSLEKRGAAPQLLGQSSIEGATFQFRIEFTDEQFRIGEGQTSFQRRAGKIKPELSFRVFDTSGQELTITRIVAQNREYQANQIIFNAPPILEAIKITVEPAPVVGRSEYEGLVAAIAPMTANLSLADLTEEDIVFLFNELELEQHLDTQKRIEWLRRSALLARQINLPMEAFYGWGRSNVPASFAELAEVPISELPSLVSRLLALETTVLNQTLQEAIAAKIIPDLGDRLNGMVTQIEQLKVAQGLLISRRFAGKLVNASDRKPLKGLRVAGFDLQANRQPKALGQVVSDDQGLFNLTYITAPIPANATPEQMQRRLKLEVMIDPQTQEKFEAEVLAADDAEVHDVQVTLPEPVTLKLEQLPVFAAEATGGGMPFGITADSTETTLVLPSVNLLTFLKSNNINSLEDLRTVGGINQLKELPTDIDATQIEQLETHTELYQLTKDIDVHSALIDKGYNSIGKIAKTPLPDFVNDLHDRIGDFNAAELQITARNLTAFLNNHHFREAADRANGLETTSARAAQVRCNYRACETAVSPLAYLADLLKFALENIKKADQPITAADLTATFHQPFDQLKASCEAVDTPVRQVRLCIEVLRGYLGARPLTDADKEAKLVEAEKAYRLAAYTSLLTKVGTSFSEIRLNRTREPAARQSLADRLGIDISHLEDLFLDPDQPTFTEAAIEELFGLVDTTRNPFSDRAQSEFLGWRLQYLRTIWKTQDWPEDAYE
jgi:hypothetical protein